MDLVEAADWIHAAVDVGAEPETEPAKETGKGLRAKLEESLARVKELEAEKEAQVGDLSGKLMNRAYQDLGLGPNAGIGKAASMIYDGQPEGLAEFVDQELGYTGSGNPLTPIIQDGYRQLDAVGETAGSGPADDDYSTALAKAEERRDNQTTMALRSQQVEYWFGGR